MNHQEFSKSISPNNFQLIQEEIIKEVLREIIEEKYGDKVLSRVIGCETVSEILVKLTLEFLHKKNIKSITRENKKEIKRLIETKRWSILEDSFDFGEDNIKLSLREIKHYTITVFHLMKMTRENLNLKFKKKSIFFLAGWMIIEVMKELRLKFLTKKDYILKQNI